MPKIPKILSTVLPSRFDMYGVHFPEEWDVTYIEAPYTQEEMTKLANEHEVEIILANATHLVSADVINNVPTLKFIQSEGVSYDKIDVAAAKARGITVCNNRGANANAVAEHTVAMMIIGLRNITCLDRRLKCEDFVTVKNDSLAAGVKEIAGRTVGFFGMGQIAKTIVEKLKVFSVNIIYYDVFRQTPENEAALGITYVEFEDLLKQSDILSLNVPVLPSTTGVFDKEAFKKMKNTAVLVNLARGEVVVNDALAWALENDEIAAAALDVMSPEPWPRDHVLLNMSQKAMDKLTLTPHIAGMTDMAFVTMLTVAIANIKAFNEGGKLVNIVPECM